MTNEAALASSGLVLGSDTSKLWWLQAPSLPGAADILIHIHRLQQQVTAQIVFQYIGRGACTQTVKVHQVDPDGLERLQAKQRTKSFYLALSERFSCSGHEAQGWICCKLKSGR